ERAVLDGGAAVEVDHAADRVDVGRRRRRTRVDASHDQAVYAVECGVLVDRDGVGGVGVVDGAGDDQVEGGAGLDRDGVGVFDGLGAQRVLPSFPTRRSSDLERAVLDGGAAVEVDHAADRVDVG